MRLVLKGSHEMLHAETQSRPKILAVLHFATDCTRRSSSALIHDALRSGTEKSMDSSVRHVRRCRMVRNTSTGWNLLVPGTDLLNGGTGTPVVLQRSESGQGILGVKGGRGMWLWSGVVVAVLSHNSVCLL